MVCAADPCDWQQPPRPDKDSLELARAFDRTNRTGEHALGMQGTLDLNMAREAAPRGGDARPFQITDGEQLVPIGAYWEPNPWPDRVRLDKRMRDLAVGPLGYRAEEIVMLAKWASLVRSKIASSLARRITHCSAALIRRTATSP